MVVDKPAAGQTPIPDETGDETGDEALPGEPEAPPPGGAP